MTYKKISLYIHRILEDNPSKYLLLNYDKIHQSIHCKKFHLNMLHNIEDKVHKFYSKSDKNLLYIFHKIFDLYIFHNQSSKMNILYYYLIKRTPLYKMYKSQMHKFYKTEQNKEDIWFLKDKVVLHNSYIHFDYYIQDNIMDKVSNFQMVFHDNNL